MLTLEYPSFIPSNVRMYGIIHSIIACESDTTGESRVLTLDWLHSEI